MQPTAIPRHKTAIRRGDFSRPVKCLLRDGLLDRSAALFDCGCGRGEDVARLQAEGYTCAGWDPAYRPDAPRHEADVVNLGYVLNVIENPTERAAACSSPPPRYSCPAPARPQPKALATIIPWEW